MNFIPVNKVIYEYTNYEKETYNTKHLIRDLKLCNEYIILFTNNMCDKNSSFIEITLYKEDEIKEKINISINTPYKLLNKNVSSLEIEIHLDKHILFDLKVLENPILFNEHTYENSPKIKDFIKNINKISLKNNKEKPYYDIKIACILDEFTYECFSYEANLMQLQSMNWLKQIKEFQPQFLFVESAWYGICKTWIEKVACEEKIDETILDIIHYCNKNNIPTVFFNKEGMINLSYFEKSSSIFDYVFVSDENIIPKQIKSSNHNKVYPLSFAAQPKIHNSINKNKFKLGEIAFAGGWYNTKHLHRVENFEYILKPALNYKVDIFDRNFHQRPILEFLDKYWPEEYLNNIVGRLDYNYMVEAYKNYSLFLNVNSIQNSSFMVSRRVYEILACKTLILTSFSQGIECNFKDYVFISKSKENTIEILENLNKHKLKNNKLAKKAQRYVLENHTYKHRLEEILDTINIKYEKSKPINIGIISIINSIYQIENISTSVLKQNYKHTFIFLVINKNISSYYRLKQLVNLPNIHSFIYESKEDLFNIFNKIYDLNKDISYYSLFNLKNYYSQNYIRDYVNVLSFVKADVIGKAQIYNFKNLNIKMCTCDNKDSYCNKLYIDTIFFNKKFFKNYANCFYHHKENIICNVGTDFIFYSDDEFNFLENMSKENIIPKDFYNFVES